ncbi:hypothetical protein CAPTEDRAFT_218025 [Capitella teleta]|uniref:Uncharacterized protein n=1 Tax=Capitella teleta TaxID=283909 RepID=R7THH6_CAPTE|nr:hypothetical protein CAPTEDRAFT_218025 [Capitella teleta]|eukprot:ELT92897.1 hypothetical protein CAPTEDRAFT_218025 [Capitella teleta]
MWLRKMVEQVTGYYTGSVAVNSSSPYFPGEGEKTKALMVLGHDVDPMPPMTAAVIIYRDMKDTLRTQFSQQMDPFNFIENPPQTYYGTKWLEFSQREAKRWVERYNSYLDIAIPVIIVQYNQLFDPVQLQNHLLRISNHLHVPIKQSILHCLMQMAQLSPLLPKPLKASVDPYDLIPRLDLIRMQQAELRVIARLEDAHDKFKPRT